MWVEFGVDLVDVYDDLGRVVWWGWCVVWCISVLGCWWWVDCVFG